MLLDSLGLLLAVGGHAHVQRRSHLRLLPDLPPIRPQPQRPPPPRQPKLATTDPAELVTCDQTIERTVNRLKGWRRVATRYEKREVNYLAMVTIAAIVLLWLE